MIHVNRFIVYFFIDFFFVIIRTVVIPESPRTINFADVQSNKRYALPYPTAGSPSSSPSTSRSFQAGNVGPTNAVSSFGGYKAKSRSYTVGGNSYGSSWNWKDLSATSTRSLGSTSTPSLQSPSSTPSTHSHSILPPANTIYIENIVPVALPLQPNLPPGYQGSPLMLFIFSYLLII
jgi:hypothetical protein